MRLSNFISWTVFFLFSIFGDLSSSFRWERAAGVGWGLAGAGYM